MARSRNSPDDLLEAATNLVRCVFPDRRLRHLPAARLEGDEVAAFCTESCLVSLENSPRGWHVWCFDVFTKTRICRIFGFDTLANSDMPLLLARQVMGRDCPEGMTFVADVHFTDEFSGQANYNLKRYSSQDGDVILHMRNVADGAEHVFELPKYGDPRAEHKRVQCHSILWHNARQEYLDSSQWHGGVPDWTIGLSGGRFDRGPRDTSRLVLKLMEERPRRAPRGRGFFHYGALSVRTHFDHKQVVTANRDWCNVLPDRTWRFKNLSAAELDDINPLLISQHERQHFRQLVTSPWGLLIFRAHLSLFTLVERVLMNLSSRSVDVEGLFPVVEWYQRTRESIRKSDRELHEHLEPAFTRIEALKCLLDEVAGVKRLTASEFARNSNSSLDIIEELLSLPRFVRWKEPSELGSEVPQFSVGDILEGAARMHEYGMLLPADNDRLVAEWKRANFDPRNSSAFTYVLSELNEPRLGLFALDAALQGLVDPSWATVLPRELEVSKDHPDARLRQVVGYVRDNWSGQMDFGAFNASMCDALGFKVFDGAAAGQVTAKVRAGQLPRRKCSRDFEKMLVDKVCAGIVRRGEIADKSYDLTRGLVPAFEIWNDRTLQGDPRSRLPSSMERDLDLVLLQAHVCGAALGDGVLDADFRFSEYLVNGKLFGKAIDSQFVLERPTAVRARIPNAFARLKSWIVS